jgi:alkanesulfonate monooxygenase SsuD/methylene tetrahydromethanopterin reductase-like flavin-dependent oxidoreductase (luciferase family)
MRLGMFVDMRNPSSWRRVPSEHYRIWLDRIAAADRMGAEMVWLTEHHFFDDGHLPQPWTLAAAIAARTERIRIGTAVNLLPIHNSVEVAEQIALVDVISDGRVEPGFGVGYRRPEHEAFGADFDRRYEIFVDRIHEIRALWGEEPGATRLVRPEPIQNPMPTWAGFRGPRGARIAGVLGLGLQWLDAELLEPYLAGLNSAGHDVETARLAGSFRFLLVDDPERAWARTREHVNYRWDSYNHYRIEGTAETPPAPVDSDEWIAQGQFILGSVDDVVSAIWESTQGLPVTDVMFWADYPGMPDDLVDRHIELAFSELQPRLRKLANIDSKTGSVHAP